MSTWRFNPRARGGRDCTAALRMILRAVFQSTRPRGARRVGRVASWSPVAVSIHAPAGGATVDSWSTCLATGFNPRARGGRDYSGSGCGGSADWVSIHAPAGGATRHGFADFAYILVSIHAPAGGATRHCFADFAYILVSIHAPAGGATRHGFADFADIPVSIHAPAGGATPLSSPNADAFGVSIHAPAGGATKSPL